MRVQAPVTSKLTWQGIEIEVTYTPLMFGGPFDHIELKAPQPLPVTETGYRSHFIHPDHMALFDSVDDFVIEWLNEWSQDPKWKETEFSSRQGELF